MQNKILPIKSIWLRANRDVTTMLRLLRNPDYQPPLPVVVKTEDEYTVLMGSNVIHAKRQMNFEVIECIVMDSYEEFHNLML